MGKNNLEFINLLKNKRPQEWSELPDIDIYMDQLVAYMSRQHIGLDESGDEVLTGAMVNNYIKKGLMPRSNGKRYDKTHIAYLTAICLLKQVLSVDDTGKMLNGLNDIHEVDKVYEIYRESLDEEMTKVAERLATVEEGEERRYALGLAISGYAQILACRKLLNKEKKGK